MNLVINLLDYGDTHSIKGSIFNINPKQKLIKIQAPKNEEYNPKENIDIIIVLDRSGSMGKFVALMLNVLYQSLIKLGFSRDLIISLITFDTHIEHVLNKGKQLTVEDLNTIPIT